MHRLFSCFIVVGLMSSTSYSNAALRVSGAHQPFGSNQFSPDNFTCQALSLELVQTQLQQPISLQARIHQIRLYVEARKKFTTLEEYQDAVTIISKGLALQSDDQKLLETLALLYSDMEAYKEAILYFSKLIENYPSRTSYRFEMSKLLYRTHRTPEAIEQLEIILDLENDNPKYRSFLAKLYRKGKQWDKARDLEDEGLNLFPGNVMTMITAGLGHYVDRQYEEALELGKKVITLYDANDSSALALIARCRSSMGFHDEAISKAMIAIEKNPLDPHLWTTIAAIFRRAKDLREAAAAARRAFALDPFNSFLAVKLIKYLLDAKLLHEAGETAARTIKLFPENRNLVGLYQDTQWLLKKKALEAA